MSRTMHESVINWAGRVKGMVEKDRSYIEVAHRKG